MFDTLRSYLFPPLKYNLYQGQLVNYSYFGPFGNLKGTGKIVGLVPHMSNLMPKYYLIEDSRVYSEKYPYHVFVCSENYIEPLSGTVKAIEPVINKE